MKLRELIFYFAACGQLIKNAISFTPHVKVLRAFHKFGDLIWNEKSASLTPKHVPKCTKNGEIKGSSFPISYNEMSYTTKMRSPHAKCYLLRNLFIKQPKCEMPSSRDRVFNELTADFKHLHKYLNLSVTKLNRSTIFKVSLV